MSSGASVFIFDENSDPYASSRIYMEALQGNDIAMAATYIDPNNLPVGIRLRTIDVSLMTNTTTQFVPTLDKTEPDDMLFMEEDASLLLLQKTDFPTLYNNQSVIYYIDPYNNSYATDVYYGFNSFYYSLDRFSTPIYIAAGLTSDFYHGYLMRYKPTTYVDCIKRENIDIKPKDNVQSYYSFFINLSNVNPPQEIRYIKPDIEPIKPKCMD